MSISGRGTAESPYLVHTALELRSKLTTANAYIKLANHIDCNDDCPLWTSQSVVANYLLLNNFDIKNMYADGAILFNQTNGLFKIQNGRFLNLTMINSAFNNDNSSGYIYKNVFYDVAIVAPSIVGCADVGYTGNNYIFNRGSYFENSVLKLNTVLSNSSHHLFYSNTSAGCGAYFKKSKLKLHTNNRDAIYEEYPLGFTGIFHDCRVESQSDIESSQQYALGRNSTADNSIFELESNSSAFSYLACTTSCINPYNSDKMTIVSSEAPVKPCTTSQIRNPTYLNSIGYTNYEVE